MPYDVVLLPGDGIGPEVLGEGRKVLELACSRAGIAVETTSIPCGGRYFLEHGRDWPEGAEQRCERADLILLGAVGWPATDRPGPVLMPDGRMAGWSAVIGNRTRLDLYANIRPVKLLAGVRHQVHGSHRAVWEAGKVDLVFVRENTEGLHAGIGGVLQPGGVKEVAIDTRVITRKASERIIRKAFELCRERSRGAPQDGVKRVTCIAKDNLLKGCQLFVEVFAEVGRSFPDVEKDYAIVDAFAQALIAQPERYDVCVTTNLFGDILTDLAAVLQGGMGLAVGCNVGDAHGMFEPIHGSAPALAGKDKANPLAMILAVGEGMRWLGRRRGDEALSRAGRAVEDAVVSVISEGSTLTFDLVGEERAARMSEVGEAVRREMGKRLGP
ncbi:MAG: isocitrate/isopropylmalate dehydrogenase family protein [Deltaproteobacteria bacterium]|nr:isocitrate/isopropylmalate dehydrogenase family protein [Deltaproteobacteria bacterium]